MKQRIVLSYSGSPASSSAVRALAARHAAEVVTLTVDVGQGGELQEVRERALAAGAVRAHVIDAREELARLYALPALQAGVPRGGWLPLIRTLSVPLIEAKVRDIAAIENAAIATDAPSPEVDANLLGRAASGDTYLLTKPPAAAPDSAAFVEIAFDRGVPVAINDVRLPLIELIESLALIAGQHGVGRVETVEAPAAVVLHAALQVGAHGIVRLKLLKGACEQVPELVTQS
ncbi:MAG TPA: argininosuccinate synthase domain-containing protein [Vicinamibacterales bacterium]